MFRKRFLNCLPRAMKVIDGVMIVIKIRKTNTLLACYALFTSAIAIMWTVASSAQAAEVQATWDYSTPPGITLVEITQQSGGSCTSIAMTRPSRSAHPIATRCTLSTT